MSEGKSINVYLWLLERAETSVPGEIGRCIVVAATEEGARAQANAECGSEGYIWTDGHSVTATLLGEADSNIENGFWPLRD